MAADNQRPSLTVVAQLSTLLVSIILASAPFIRSQDVRVRLTGGTSASEGRVEVFFLSSQFIGLDLGGGLEVGIAGGAWGTVCSDLFDYIDAGVVCNSLGFGYRGTVVKPWFVPEDETPLLILMDDVKCQGYESTIHDCVYKGPSRHNCTHSQDVFVSCGMSPVHFGPLPNPDNFFIVADLLLRNVYQVDAVSGATGQLLPFGGASSPAAVAYDPSAKAVYWTDLGYHTINRYSLLTNRSTVIYRNTSNTAVYIGLAIDVERQKLYYADASTAGGNVGELSTDGTDHRELHSDPYSKPQSVVFDANNRTLYWTDSGRNPAIHRSSVTNVARVTLISRGLRAPSALAVDFTAGVMFWGDDGLDRIMSASVSGLGRRSTVKSDEDVGALYCGFALADRQNIYFTDWLNPYIRRINFNMKTTLSLSATKVSNTPFQRLCGIVFVPGTRKAPPVPGELTTAAGSESMEDSATTSDNVLSVITITVACGVVLIVIAVGVFVVVNKYIKSPASESSCLRRLRLVRHPRLSPDGSAQLSTICDHVPLYSETSFINPMYDAYELETISSTAAMSDADPSDSSDPISDDTMHKYLYGVSPLTTVTS